MLETVVLPSRVVDYSPALLDELTSAGEVVWIGHSPLPGNDGWVSLHLADTAPLLAPVLTDLETDPLQQQILDALGDGGALFFRALAQRLGLVDDRALVDALWALAWTGRLTNDTLAPLRAYVHGRTARATPRTRSVRRGRPVLPSRPGPPTVAGRWSLLPERDTDPTRRAHALAEALGERHGRLPPGALTAARVARGWGG